VSQLTTRQRRIRRHKRVRKDVFGTAERPRLVVFRSNRGIAAQLVDDAESKTLAAASWLDKKNAKGAIRQSDVSHAIRAEWVGPMKRGSS
jgi:large subunit ribosomal protein L18